MNAQRNLAELALSLDNGRDGPFGLNVTTVFARVRKGRKL
jgi:hypothetical protein